MPDVRPRPAATPARALASPTKIGGASVIALATALILTPLMSDEGRRSATYLDIARVPTDCYGHTGADVGRVGTPHTDAQCETLLTGDVRAKMAAVLACTPTLADRPQQLAAATRLAYNIGSAAYCHSGTASAFRRADWRHGCDLMLVWDKARVGGKLVQVPGLAARRQRERVMCLVGVA